MLLGAGAAAGSPLPLTGRCLAEDLLPTVTLAAHAVAVSRLVMLTARVIVSHIEHYFFIGSALRLRLAEERADEVDDERGAFDLDPRYPHTRGYSIFPILITMAIALCLHCCGGQKCDRDQRLFCEAHATLPLCLTLRSTSISRSTRGPKR